VLAFAHRGGAYHPEIEGLENTMAAFRHAVSLGYRHLETDVHVTRDGVLLAFHDSVLDRVTDRVGSIAETSYADVQRALIGGRERVPTLAELFDAFPDARFNIDLKSHGAVEALADFLDEREAWDRVVVGSFSVRRMRAFRSRTAGRVATSANPLEVAAYVVLPSAGLVRRAHANGLDVHVWTIDDPDEMHLLLDRGVDGLMTDRTDILRDVLRSRGLWEEPS
jgi:glycerophosphoryl diester phosphodiesterase